MMTKNSYILLLGVILFSSSIVPYSYASVESEAQEDLMAGCRDGQTLVYRSTYLDYVCVDHSAAERWVELGIAEIIQESTGTDKSNVDVTPYEEKYPGAPPLPPKKSPSTNTDSECRDGQVLIYHFSYHDTFCTNMFTALSWERLGMVEIVKDSISVQDDVSVEFTADSSSENIDTTIDLSIEEEQEIVMEEEFGFVEVFPQFSHNSGEYPIIRGVDRNVWSSIDYDGSTSFFIEGDGGIIVINSLSSYQSTKKIIDELEKISDKKIKAVILTKISPEVLFALEAYVERSDDSIKIIISEDLLEHYELTFNSKVENTIVFSSSLSVDIVGINLELFTNDKQDSFQTLIYFPDNDGLIIGDSVYGMFPFLFDIGGLSSFLTEELENFYEND
jgi:hypothetical protein